MKLRQANKIVRKAAYTLTPVGRLAKALRVMWHHWDGYNRFVSDNTVVAIARNCNNFVKVK